MTEKSLAYRYNSLYIYIYLVGLFWFVFPAIFFDVDNEIVNDQANVTHTK